jgi:hypothetical protein
MRLGAKGRNGDGVPSDVSELPPGTEKEENGKTGDFKSLHKEQKAMEFKIFEPTSRSKTSFSIHSNEIIIYNFIAEFVNETQKESLFSLTADFPLYLQSQPDPLSKFPRFHFVNLDGPRSYSPASRSITRAHVMRRACKEKDEARKAESTIPDRALYGTAASLSRGRIPIGRHHLQSQSNRQDIHATHTSISASQPILPGQQAPQTFARERVLDAGLLWESDPRSALATSAVISQWTSDMELIHHCTSSPINYTHFSMHFKCFWGKACVG